MAHNGMRRRQPSRSSATLASVMVPVGLAASACSSVITRGEATVEDLVRLITGFER